VEIAYERGDATQPQGSGPRLIVHICNDIGAWGKGFVLALSRRWHEPEQQYRAWSRQAGPVPFALGQVQFVLVGDALWVANLIGQHGIRDADNLIPIRYDAVRQGLARVAEFAQERGSSVHMPRIGTGLAGGNWDEISQIITDELVGRGIAVTIYDLP
jgi:O-acetyl-ADP-ribose deacetylase (regulator of RNase III)